MQQINEINKDAFAVEQAQVTKQLADQADASRRWLEVNAPHIATINQLAHELGQDGVPRAAAMTLANRIAELESRLAALENARTSYTPPGLERR